MARYIRSETGIAMDAYINRYDGEPYTPAELAQEIKDKLANKPCHTLDVTEADAREIACHYLRTHNGEKSRPGKICARSSKWLWRANLVCRIDR